MVVFSGCMFSRGGKGETDRRTGQEVVCVLVILGEEKRERKMDTRKKKKHGH